MTLRRDNPWWAAGPCRRQLPEPVTHLIPRTDPARPGRRPSPVSPQRRQPGSLARAPGRDSAQAPPWYRGEQGPSLPPPRRPSPGRARTHHGGAPASSPPAPPFRHGRQSASDPPSPPRERPIGHGGGARARLRPEARHRPEPRNARSDGGNGTGSGSGTGSERDREWGRRGSKNGPDSERERRRERPGCGAGTGGRRESSAPAFLI